MQCCGASGTLSSEQNGRRRRAVRQQQSVTMATVSQSVAAGRGYDQSATSPRTVLAAKSATGWHIYFIDYSIYICYTVYLQL